MKGQAALEYIFLLLVVVILFNTILFKNPTVKNFFKEEGPLDDFYQETWSSSYRHALFLMKDTTESPNENLVKHQSYTDGSSTRFFGPKEKYP